MSGHLDELALLRFWAAGNDDPDSRAAGSHLAECASCRIALKEIQKLDRELRALTRSGAFGREPTPSSFGPGDAFRRRPAVVVRKTRRPGTDVLEISDAGLASSLRLLDGLRSGRRPSAALRGLRRGEGKDRFTLYYALQETGRRIAESPGRALEFARAVLGLAEPSVRRAAAEQMMPWGLIQGQAHLLAAQALLWPRQFARSYAHSKSAYRLFARWGDDTSLAIVEMTESQRRSFVGKGPSALALARRAEATFAAHRLDDFAARATVAMGLASYALNQHEEAIRYYRLALPVFERYELWSNYVGALNSIGTSFQKMGRLDQAKREFARALSRFSAEEHRSWMGYLRHGLASILFSAGRFREAAVSSARAGELLEAAGLHGNAVTCALLEIEAWARHGDLGRARKRLDAFLSSVRGARRLEPVIVREIQSALSGEDPDFARIAALREEIEELFQRVPSQASR